MKAYIHLFVILFFQYFAPFTFHSYDCDYTSISYTKIVI
jgi:hypothetical protein